MAGKTIWCRLCGFGLAWQAGLRKPVVCPTCNNNERADWDDLPPFRVSEQDRQFLSTIKIRVEK